MNDNNGSDFLGSIEYWEGRIYDEAVKKRGRELDYYPEPVTDHPGQAQESPDRGASKEEWSALYEDYRFIFNMFDGVDKPDPKDSDPVITACQTARAKIQNEDDADIHKVKAKLDEYTSQALEAFKNNVVDKFNEAQQQHLVALASLQALAEANKEVAQLRRDKALEIAEETHKALVKLPSGAGFDLGLVAALLFVAGGAVALPAAVAAGATAAIASTSLYLLGSTSTATNILSSNESGAKQIGGDTKISITGDSVDSVLQSASDALSKLNDEMEVYYDKMIETASHNRAVISGQRHQFLPPANDPDTKVDEADIADIDETVDNPAADMIHNSD